MQTISVAALEAASGRRNRLTVKKVGGKAVNVRTLADEDRDNL